MSAEYTGNRWWENYLVRYLMPSIAGVAIVGWLCSYGGDGLREILLLPPSGKQLDATSLTLMFLYGNLFCYIASYPILVFHVTRVLDFPGGNWSAKFYRDGYIATITLTLAAFTLFHLPIPEDLRFYLGFVLAVIVVIVQVTRLWIAISPRIIVDGLDGDVSPTFGFTYALARRRGVTENLSSVQSDATIREDWRDDWRQDFIATYRHMREHGNSAFIFLLELALAALTYCVITKPGQSPQQQLGAIGALFAVWALPAVLVHLLGQHLERRFSRFDRRILPAAPPPRTPENPTPARHS